MQGARWLAVILIDHFYFYYCKRFLASWNSIFHIISLYISHLHRFFRFLRFSNGLQIIKYTLIASSKELMLLALLLLLPVAFFATVVYFCEREVCFHTSTWWSKLLVSKIIKHNPRKHTTSFWRCNNVVPCLLECWKSYPLNSMSIIWLKRNHISEIKLLNVGTERPRSNVQRTLFLNNISFHLENYSI